MKSSVSMPSTVSHSRRESLAWLIMQPSVCGGITTHSPLFERHLHFTVLKDQSSIIYHQPKRRVAGGKPVILLKQNGASGSLDPYAAALHKRRGHMRALHKDSRIGALSHGSLRNEGNVWHGSFFSQ